MTEHAKGADPLYTCCDCGLDLTPEQWQLEWVMKYGNPIPRPPCPANENGLHRISDEAFQLSQDSA